MANDLAFDYIIFLPPESSQNLHSTKYYHSLIRSVLREMSREQLPVPEVALGESRLLESPHREVL
jgi:hypothetical protein